MPPRKRALTEKDTNAQPKRAKSAKNGKATKKGKATDETRAVPDVETGTDDKHEHGHSQEIDDCPSEKVTDFEKRGPFEYICIDLPNSIYAAEDSNEDLYNEENDESNESVDGPSGGQSQPSTARCGKNEMWPKSAADHPGWKWIMMVDSWKRACEMGLQTQYRQPDHFGMYVYNDFFAYGMLDLIKQNLAIFHDNHKSTGKANDVEALRRMWVVVAALSHLLAVGALGDGWLGADDGFLVSQTCDLIGCALLTALDNIDRSGKLSADSEFRDIGLVMASVLKFSAGVEDCIDGTYLEWRKNIFAYAKKAGIDLSKTPFAKDLGDMIDKFKGTRALTASKKADRWNWKNKFEKTYFPSPFHGQETYDITKWTRKERAKWAFDKKDPLKDIPEKDLREGNIMLA